MTEAEYGCNLELIRGQVAIAEDSFYMEREINQIASGKRAVFNKLNSNAAFWNRLLHSLQSNFFMTLGRLFDTKTDVLSVHKLLTVTVAHPEYFSKAALRARKIALSRGKPEWLDAYMESVWEPTALDLRVLKKAVAPFSAKFDSIYRPIRNEVFGHNAEMDDQIVFKMFQKIQVKEIDEILHFLHDLVQALSDMFLNGRKPGLGKGEYTFRQQIRESVERVLFDLARIKPKNATRHFGVGDSLYG